MSDFNLPAGVSEDELDLDAYNKSNQASANEKAAKELCPAGYQIARVGEMIRYLEDRVKFGFKADDPNAPRERVEHVRVSYQVFTKAGIFQLTSWGMSARLDVDKSGFRKLMVQFSNGEDIGAWLKETYGNKSVWSIGAVHFPRGGGFACGVTVKHNTAQASGRVSAVIQQVGLLPEQLIPQVPAFQPQLWKPLLESFDFEEIEVDGRKKLLMLPFDKDRRARKEAMRGQSPTQSVPVIAPDYAPPEFDGD